MTDKNADEPAAPATAQIRGQHQMMNVDQALDIAGQYHAAGDLDSTQVLCNRIVERWPNQPIALNLLGICAYQLGKPEIAADYFARATRLRPEYTEAHYNLGNALKALSRMDAACASYSRALALNPQHCDAHYNMGNARKAQGRLEEALTHYSQAIAIKPDFADAHNNSGNTLKTQGRLGEAVAAYQSALRSNPDYAAAHYNLGTTLQALERPAEAIAHYQNAIALKPDLAVAHGNLGTALRTLGRLDEALAHYQKAIAIAPGFATAHNNLAALYERSNQLEAAEDSSQRALAIAPDNADSQFIKAILLRRRGNNEEAVRTLKALSAGELSETYAIRRYFELGKLLDASLDSEKAFNYYAQGNLLQARSGVANSFNKDSYLARIAAMRDALKPGWAGKLGQPGLENNGDSPIFLIGFPRSGTTLLEQILDGHPQVQVMEEKRAFASVENAIASMPEAYPLAIADLPETQIRELRALYFQNVDMHFARREGQFFVDKFPLNTEYVPLIKRLFPEAKFILACRHPCDVVLSNFMQYYKLNDAMVNFFSLADTVALYQQVMGLWLQCVELLPLSFHRVSYESLVSNLEAEAGDLFRFLDIDWDASVLDFHSHARQKVLINTPSYEQVTEPVYQSAKDRWRRYEAQLAPFYEDLAPFIQKFGYSIAD